MRIPVKAYGVANSGIATKAMSAIADDRDTVLPDWKDRRVGGVRQLELACFAIEHVATAFYVRCGG